MRGFVSIASAFSLALLLGSQAVALGCAQPLIRRADGTLRRMWGLFKEGLRYFVQVVQRQTLCLDLVFIPDRRFS